MSDADPEAVTVSADGITVRKTVDTEQFQTLAVVIELASARDDVARVQLIDQLPPTVPMDDVGFHPDYGSEYWSVEDATVAFERDLEPGEAYTTIYGIRDYHDDDAGALLEEPHVGLVDTGPDSIDEVIDEDRTKVVREFLSGEADLPGLGDEITADAPEPAAPPAEPVEAAGEVEASEPVDAEPEPVTGQATAGATAEPEPQPAPAGDAEPAVGATSSDDGREVRVPLTGGVVRVLIKELRDGDIDPEDRRMLRDELLDTEGATEARIGHLQQRVSNLEAYADAIEAFIDEEGTAQAIISDLRDEVAGLERTVRATDDRLDEVLDGMEAVEDRLDALGDDVATVESRGEVLADRVEDIEDDVTGLDQHLDDLGTQIDQVSVDVDGVDDRTSDLDTRMDDVQDELGGLRRELRDDLEALQTDLEDFESFRNRLSSVFGSAGEPLDEESSNE